MILCPFFITSLMLRVHVSAAGRNDHPPAAQKEFHFEFSECVFNLSGRDSAKEKAVQLNGPDAVILKSWGVENAQDCGVR